MTHQTEWLTYGGNTAENYELHMIPAIFGPWASDLVELTALRPGERVLDVACGTGVVTRLAAQQVGGSGKVVGLDLNPTMLAVAAANWSNSTVPIEWREASVAAMPFGNNEFDAVLCQQGLQFFPDRAAALREMHRVMVSRGRLVLSVWRSMEYSPGFTALAEGLRRRISEAAGTALRSGPFSLADTETVRALLSEAGFHDIQIRPARKMLHFLSLEEFVRQYVAATPLAVVVAQADDDARAALISDVGTALRSYVDDDGLAFPIESNLVVARTY